MSCNKPSIWLAEPYPYSLYSFPGLSSTLFFFHFYSVMVVWGLGFRGWGLELGFWCEAIWSFFGLRLFIFTYLYPLLHMLYKALSEINVELISLTPFETSPMSSLLFYFQPYSYLHSIEKLVQASQSRFN